MSQHDEEVQVQDVPVARFVVETELNGAMQLEASKALNSTKLLKIMNYVCYALCAVMAGGLVVSYFSTGNKTSLMMAIMMLLMLAYMIYSRSAMPKRAIRRWEDSIYKAYGSNSLHLCTEFYEMNLAQLVREDEDAMTTESYSALSEIRETEHLFLLRQNKRQWFFVAKDGFTKGTAEELRSFLSGRIGG